MSDVVSGIIVFGFLATVALGEVWFVYAKILPGQARFIFSLTFGSVFGVLSIYALVTYDVGIAVLCAVTSALWLWIAWKDRPRRRRRTNRVSGLVKVLGHRLVVVSISVKR